MALQIIGAGLPRTGTATLKLAFEQLGFGPCYHMTEVFRHPAHWRPWTDAFRQGAEPWDEIFADFRSCTDAPACMKYRELAAHYPDAKVVLTLRDAERWFDSTQATILSPALGQTFAGAPPELQAFLQSSGWHGGDAANHDRERMLANFHAHNAAVRASIPAARLLVYEVAAGWEPLCRFLGVPVPDAPFPHVNSTEDFQHMLAEMAALGAPDPDRMIRSWQDKAALPPPRR